MKTSIAVTAFLVAGTGAASAGALPSPFQGSDTLFDLSNQVITASGLTGTYQGGGSGAGEKALVAGTQQEAPMSRMMNNTLCTLPLGTLQKSEGIVIGLDAVDVFADTSYGTCNGTGGGLKHDATPTGWKSALRLVYMGEVVSGQVVCNGPSRTAAVANWGTLFNSSCTQNSACGTGGALLHAYRRDDFSGTADVFASVVGIPSGSPSVSAGSAKNFGATPYCNAVNWDQATANVGTPCSNGVTKQFVGPGGVFDATAADGVHRRPPSGAWGDTAAGTQPDVQSTSYQDNDPIRTLCKGTGNGNATRPGEQVCNTDGKLGLVLPVASVDWVQNQGKDPFPNGSIAENGHAIAGFCDGGFIKAKTPTVFTCPFRGTAGTFHSGLCGNNDTPSGGLCNIPVHGASSQCEAIKSTVPAICGRPDGKCSADGRSFNLFMADGTAVQGSAGTGYLSNVSYSGTTAEAFTGAFTRIHMTQTWPSALGAASACANLDATGQVGCLVHADQCSLGFAGDSGFAAAQNVRLLVNDISASVSTVQDFSYPLTRKLYNNTVNGFGALTGDELTFSSFEGSQAGASNSTLQGLLTSDGFFQVGPAAPGGGGKAYCEDFNEAANCPTVAGSTANVNACAVDSTSVGVPTAQNTVCGNGVKEYAEECDDGPANGAAPANCSIACRLN